MHSIQPAIQESLQKLARGLVEADTVAGVASEVLQITRDIFEWDAFLFSERITGTDEFIRVTAWDTFDGRRVELDPARHPPRPYRTAHELHRGRPLLVEQEEAAKQYLNRFGDETRLSASLLFAPIHYRGVLHGICSVQSYTPGRYTQADLATLATVCEIAAPALRRTRAERELAEKVAELREANHEIGRTTAMMATVYGISKSVHSTGSLGELYPRIHDAIRGAIGAENLFIALYRREDDTIGFPYVANEHDRKADEQEILVRMVLDRDEPLHIDEESFRLLADANPSDLRTEVPKCWLGIPLRAADEFVGVMALQSYTDAGAYGPDVVEMLEFVSSEVTGAIVHVRAEEKRRVEEGRYRRAIACAGAVPYERVLGSDGWTEMGDGIRGIIGYEPSEITTDLWRAITLETIPRGELAGLSFEQALVRVFAGQCRTWKADSLVVRKDGEKRWISDSSVVLFDPEGNVRGTLGMLEDITDRMNALRLHEALSDLGRLLSGASTPQDVAIAASRVMDDIFGWDAFFLDVFDSRTGLAHAVLNIDMVEGERREVESIYREPTPPSPTFRHILDKGSLLIHDATRDTCGRPSAAAYGDKARRSASLLFVRVKAGAGSPFTGMISLQSYAPGKYTQSDMEMLEVLAGQCGAAVFRTFAEQEEAKARSHAAAFGQLAQRLGLALTPREAGLVIAEEADRLLGWDACFFDMYDASAGSIVEMLNMDIVDGVKKEVTGHHKSGPPAPSERRMLAEGAFMVEQDSHHARDASLEMFGDSGRPSACLLYAPARHGTEVVGFLSIQSYTPGAYKPEDLDTLQALADHCAGALKRIRLEEAISASNERYALAASGANDGLWDWNILTGQMHFSDRWKTMQGLPASEPLGSIDDWLDRTHPEDHEALDAALRDHLDGRTEHFEHEHRIMHRNGTWLWVLARAAAVRSPSGRAVRMAGSLTDISARKQTEAQLVRSAFYDPLTGLANRALFIDRLDQAFKRARRTPAARFAVLFLDLDRFKNVNDTLGHPAGDKLLTAVAHRLARHFRSSDTVARMGGDEFTVLVEQYRNQRDIVAIADRLVEEFTVPFDIDGHDVYTSASIGIATSEHDYDQYEDLLRDADTALYRAKELGKNRHEVFDQKMRETVLASMDTETGIRNALLRGEFQLYYQPVFALDTGTVSGFEALIRWNHPTRGIVGPAAFMPTAEESGLILQVGEWVVGEACRQMAEWRKDHEAARNCYVSINVSARQFASSAISGLLEENLKKHRLDGDALRVELTETALLREPERVRPVLDRWKKSGVQIMLDDFGTGYSSLTHLNQYSVDYLKIDRSFVNTLDATPQSQHIVRAVISLAGILKMKVIAEGAETREQCELLRELHCDFVQGYYLSRPIPASQVGKFFDFAAFRGE